jgi:hypothetical protein
MGRVSKKLHAKLSKGGLSDLPTDRTVRHPVSSAFKKDHFCALGLAQARAVDCARSVPVA